MSRRRRRKANQNSVGLPVSLALIFLLILGVSFIISYVESHPWVLLIPLVVLVGVGLLGVYILRRRAEDEQQWLQAQTQRRQAEEEQRLLFAQHIGNLLSLTPREFELTIGSLLQAQGYQQVRHTGASGDLAADLHAVSPQGEYVVVQCKRYAPGQKIGTPDIQKFIGMMTVHHRAQKGIFVTTSTFTAPALALAQQHNLELINGQQLASLFTQINRGRMYPRLSG